MPPCPPLPNNMYPSDLHAQSGTHLPARHVIRPFGLTSSADFLAGAARRDIGSLARVFRIGQANHRSRFLRKVLPVCSVRQIPRLCRSARYAPSGPPPARTNQSAAAGPLSAHRAAPPTEAHVRPAQGHGRRLSPGPKDPQPRYRRVRRSRHCLTGHPSRQQHQQSGRTHPQQSRRPLPG